MFIVILIFENNFFDKNFLILEILKELSKITIKRESYLRSYFVKDIYYF